MTKLTQPKIEETVPDSVAEEPIQTEEVASPLLNEAVPERLEPGHQSRDFFTPLS